jgi:ribosomal protein S18 acetylase RimI-like enzyme
LIAQALRDFHAAGFSRAVLDVDGESDIGGLAIYSRLGFRIARKRTSFVRTLPAR